MPSARIDPDRYASDNADKFVGMARILSKKYPKAKINSRTLAAYAGQLLLVREARLITCERMVFCFALFKILKVIS